jgi:uncharacterized protein
MSASENKATTQAAYLAFSAGDLDGAMANVADDIEWVLPGNSTVSGTYRGKQEVLGFFAMLASKSFHTNPQHFIADGDHVVVLTNVTADGQSYDQADVLTFVDGKVAHFLSHGDTALGERIWGTK